MSYHPWKDWYQECCSTLRQIPIKLGDPEFVFLHHYYMANQPILTRLPHWPIDRWDISQYEGRVGDNIIQYQKGRAGNPEYEWESHALRATGTFNQFSAEMKYGPDNDVYIVAQNHAFNQNAMRLVYNEGVGVLPAFLTPAPQQGFMWFGGATMTPLHHDKTNNFLCQVMGDKLVRMVAPDQFDKVDHRAGVHSNIKWLDEGLAKKRGIVYTDYWLHPGYALFIPVGWWHCVRTFHMSHTLAYTNFIWPNDFVMGSL